jgi:bifunctional pyridoxal-dependent enzyme with beta-cystathionase and maltose regulon repressor activities
MLSGDVNYYVQQLVAYLEEVRDLAYERLSKMPLVKFTPLDGTYIMFPDLGAYRMSSNQLTDYILDKARVAVESGSAYGPAGEGHIRINIGTSKEILT